ncbi:MAG: CPBP family intramembrane metalloprotease [Actinomycetales bacterium]|nr:CPBP family intramembrane metalloprotease [Actinomycetales bacterium]
MRSAERIVAAWSWPMAAGWVGWSAAALGYAVLLAGPGGARNWWGAHLIGTAAAYAPVFLVPALLALRRGNQRSAVAAFIATGYLTVVLVTWLPRQSPAVWPQEWRLIGWGLGCIAVYCTGPLIFARLRRVPLRSLGLQWGAWRWELILSGALIPAILVIAWVAAGLPAFQAMYPFYDTGPGRPVTLGLVAWWALYAGTFAALEFYFRGFLVGAGTPLLGWWAIPAMAAPYCLLHLDKPLPELVSSLMGGLALGVVARLTGSILTGVLAHIGLALSTDAAVLLRSPR